jgi:uncharacterized protein involved in response to NO
LLALANCAFHVEMMGAATGLIPIANAIALHVPLIIVLIVSGRIIPLFTQNALMRQGISPEDGTLRSRNGLDHAAWALALVTLVGDCLALLDPRAHLSAGIASAITGVVVAWRMRGWRSHKTLRMPIVWVLHVAHAFTALGYLALASSYLMPHLGLLRSSALHVFTMGALGLFCIGMMSRVSLGHSGRDIHAPVVVVLGYLLLPLAVFVRVVGPLAIPQASSMLWDSAVVCWSVAFASFFVRYFTVWTTPRADGRPD